MLRAATLTKQRRQSIRQSQSETSAPREGSIVSGGIIKESINEDRNEDEENNWSKESVLEQVVSLPF